MSDVKLPPMPPPTAFLLRQGSEVIARAWSRDEMTAYALEAIRLNAQPVDAQAQSFVPAGYATFETAVREYIEEYEMIGETEGGTDASYTPNDNDKALLLDAFMGFDFSPWRCQSAPMKAADEFELRRLLEEEKATVRQLTRALRNATEPPTFMGEPVLSAPPAVPEQQEPMTCAECGGVLGHTRMCSKFPGYGGEVAQAPNAQQAEPALKPMTAHRAAYFMQRFRNEEKLLGPNEQAALKFTIEALEAMETQQAEAQEPCAWRREWDGDDSDIGQYVYASAEDELDGLVWEPLFTRPQPAQLQTRIAELESQLDAVAKDAERYRWLRKTTNFVTSGGERIDVRNSPDLWDSSIDAAIARTKEQP